MLNEADAPSPPCLPETLPYSRYCLSLSSPIPCVADRKQPGLDPRLLQIPQLQVTSLGWGGS